MELLGDGVRAPRLRATSPKSGVAWTLPSPYRLVRVGAADGDEKTLLESEHVIRAVTPSRDETHLLVAIDQEGTLVLDARTGAVVGGPWKDGYATWPAGAATGRFVVRDNTVWRSLVDLSTGRTIDCGPFRHRALPDVVELEGGRVVTLTADALVELRDAEGDVVRRLLPPEEN
jgi:hypothetical protein